jgi:hypothetical protein
MGYASGGGPRWGTFRSRLDPRPEAWDVSAVARLDRTRRYLGRMHGAIPDQYQVPLADLERTLNEWRERYGRADA